jgi:hypothetical protein
MNWRRIMGLRVFCQAAWTSLSEYMGWGPKKKNERSGSWWQKKEYIKYIVLAGASQPRRMKTGARKGASTHSP